MRTWQLRNLLIESEVLETDGTLARLAPLALPVALLLSLLIAHNRSAPSRSRLIVAQQRI